MIKPTNNELQIIHKIRQLRPFEKLEIVGDKRGEFDTFMVVKSRTEKILYEKNVDPKHFE